LRKAIGLLFWLLVILVVWHWPGDERPASAPAAVPAAVIEVERPATAPEAQRGSGPDFGSRQPRPYRQQ
jgi:hypothetical protein